MKVLGWSNMTLLTCQKTIVTIEWGPENERQKKEQGRNCSYTEGLIRYEGWKMEKGGAAERDRKEPDWTILGD